MNREFLMLSQNLDAQKGMISLGNWFASEKMDGVRAIWLPDTKGHRIGDLPMANLDKDVSGHKHRLATGLWSRYANPIFAPEWWLNQLPRERTLDGELWIGRGKFQETCSAIKKHQPIDAEWNRVIYSVFDSPSFDTVYQDGKIHNLQLKKQFKGLFQWCQENLGYKYNLHTETFDHTYFRYLMTLHNRSPNLRVHDQKRLSWKNSVAREELSEMLEIVLKGGGEGIIVRQDTSSWHPKRMSSCLKVKPSLESEAKVIGFTMGEGRLVGMIGSLTVEDVNSGKVFGLSGLTDTDRTYPSTKFQIGTIVTYIYRELTTDGMPREARFLRIRGDV